MPIGLLPRDLGQPEYPFTPGATPEAKQVSTLQSRCMCACIDILSGTASPTQEAPSEVAKGGDVRCAMCDCRPIKALP